jgi:hypothetical protein
MVPLRPVAMGVAIRVATSPLELGCPFSTPRGLLLTWGTCG